MRPKNNQRTQLTTKAYLWHVHYGLDEPTETRSCLVLSPRIPTNSCLPGTINNVFIARQIEYRRDRQLHNRCYHINKVPTGYKFNVMTPSKLCAKFEQYVSPMRGKLRKLYGGLVPQVKSLGKVEKENNSAMLVNIGGKNKALLAMQDDKVILQMGALTSAEQKDI